ncbi:hypothetical protein [Sporosarcina sp. resist]|uniref:hypothetical protein n=1 Tax=Sporosarcina sp. resist TaxID=2762563 RepID=UPI001C9A642A|nr:hypothetical protein [Sporosarcina sp. resist]
MMYTNENLAELALFSYDERISAKTTTRMSAQGHVYFNLNTLQFVDRVIILQFNAEEMELESGTIEVFEDGVKQVVVKPILWKLAGMLSIYAFNSKGNPYNTRQLGTLIIRELI